MMPAVTPAFPKVKTCQKINFRMNTFEFSALQVICHCALPHLRNTAESISGGGLQVWGCQVTPAPQEIIFLLFS